MRSFNFTGRVSIDDSNVVIKVYEYNKKVEVNINLSSYNFPENASCFIEPYISSNVRAMRVDLGTLSVSDICKSFFLTEFDDLSGVRFRIKVTCPNTGRLYGLIEQILPKVIDSNGHLNRSILPVKSADLSDTNELWRLDIDDELVVLELDISLGSKDSAVRNELFMMLVLPAAVRQIYQRFKESIILEDRENRIVLEWVRFAELITSDSPSRDNYEQWVDDVISGLVKKIASKNAAISLWEKL